MTNTVLALFDSRQNAEDAINALRDRGFDPQDISIIMKDQGGAEQIAENTGGTNVANSTVTGVTTGAVVGGLAALLGATLIPGFGAFLIGGPIAAALGLTGVAATTVSGAATGAVAGGLLGALAGLGLNNEEATVYESHINEGAILLAIPSSENTSEVEDVLDEFGATDIKNVKASDDYVRRSRRTRSMADKDPSSTRRVSSRPKSIFWEMKHFLWKTSCDYLNVVWHFPINSQIRAI